MSDLDHTHEERDLVEAMAAVWHDVMSNGDKSTAIAIAKTSEDDQGNMLTSRGSPNDRFWSLMIKLGWAVEVPEAVENLPMSETFVAFTLTDKGKPMLPQFIQAVT